eukprot:1184641-Prorocentrum_minimum.AAC.1
MPCISEAGTHRRRDKRIYPRRGPIGGGTKGLRPPITKRSPSPPQALPARPAAASAIGARY